MVRANSTHRETGYMAAIPERYFQEKNLVYWEHPYKARIEPPGKAIFIQGSRRLYDLPVLSVAGTLSITSNLLSGGDFRLQTTLNDAI
ncbi:Yersinia protein of uncharacterised function (DUF3831) [Yersinia pseudotuberculosis]|uniref:Yersinia protein of uncharacterized function (DUF3831) n=1 Tax=Yersinia pseudotuberculosis TaxID=633 RepID=A0A380Q5Y1_YERPU|nr:Yersinia protein of uncharacterised function (DUF3831) [Yersinia pseudotuberculosis]